MQLNQFGAVMTFAIEMEDKLTTFYQEAAAKGGSNAAELSERADSSAKRSKRILKSRQNDVTEITLEPIAGLDEADYALDLSATSATAINAAEEIVKKFYTEAAPKINVRESRRVLERCLKEHAAFAALAD